ncbi:MAG: V-type ATPase 116kDa subunit family protein [Candidatus Paceibacterota bacterium]
MAILPMQKIRLALSQSDTSRVLEAIQKLGVIEFRKSNLESLQSQQQTDFEYSYAASRLDFAVSFLSQYEKQSMVSKILEGTAVHTSEEDILKTVEAFDATPVITEAQHLEERLNKIEARRRELNEEELAIQPWVGLSIDLSQELVTDRTTTTLLRIDPNTISEFEQSLGEADLDVHIENVAEEAYRLTYLTEDEESVQNIFNRLSIEIVTLPNKEGTPKEALRAISEERQELTQEHEACIEQAQSLTEHLPNLRKLADYMHWKEQSTALIYDHGRSSSSVHVFEGWCPKRELDQLYHTIDEITHAFTLEHIEPAENEEPPVAIENKKRIRPFETVTNLYGVPTYKDIDPTPFFSGFFFISFGLCLTDVGYGIFLSILTGLIMLLYRVPRGMKQLLTLLFYGGIASTIVGLFFGGYFGINMNLMPEVLQNLQYFDPIASPLPFFYLTLAIGFAQIYLGLILDVVRSKRNGELNEGIMDSGPWLLLLAGVALYIGDMVQVLPSSPLYLWTIITGVVALVLTQGRKESNIFAKGFKGVLSLYGAIDYFSNVLSYSRLLALGLATSALAFSVNLIATMLRDMVPVVGLLVMVLVLLVGHSFNLIINVLGAFIHTARLQFVEFFGKFIQGTGNVFQPFERIERNVALDEVIITEQKPTSADSG